MWRASVQLLVLAAVAIGVGCAPDARRDHTGASGTAAPASSGPTPPVATVTLPARITSVAALNGSSSIAVGLAGGRVAVWTTKGEPILLKPHATDVMAVGSSQNGEEIWSIAEDGSLAHTRLTTGASTAIGKIDLGPAPTSAVAFSADGSVLVTGGAFGDLRVFDTATGALRHTLRGHRTELQTVAIRRDSAVLASASSEADLKVWDIVAGRQLSSTDLNVAMFAIAFNPTNDTLASGGVDRRVTLRDAKTLAAGASVDLKAPMMVAAIAWSPDGRLLAIGDLDDATLSKGGLRIVNADTRVQVANLDTGGIPPYGLTFIDGSRVLVGVVQKDLRAWQVP